MQTPQTIAMEISTEVERSATLHPNLHNMHEGLAVIWEEFEEFKTEVFLYNPPKNRDTREKARAELIQLAAMCVRTIIDCELP